MRRGSTTILVLGLITAILVFSGAYYLKQINKQPPVNTQPPSATNGYQQSPYASAEDCQNKTGKKCIKSLCQVLTDMPLEEQKKYTETCVTGWVPEESLSPAVNWKTYTNLEGKYSVKYPADWDIEGPIDYNVETPKYPGMVFIFKTTEGGDYVLHSPKLSFKVIPSEKTLQEVENDPLTVGLPTPNKVTSSKAYLGGVQFIKYIASKEGYQPFTKYITAHDGKIYEIIITGLGGQDESPIDQILSAFQFLG